MRKKMSLKEDGKQLKLKMEELLSIENTSKRMWYFNRLNNYYKDLIKHLFPQINQSMIFQARVGATVNSSPNFGWRKESAVEITVILLSIFKLKLDLQQQHPYHLLTVGCNMPQVLLLLFILTNRNKMLKDKIRRSQHHKRRLRFLKNITQMLGLRKSSHIMDLLFLRSSLTKFLQSISKFLLENHLIQETLTPQITNLPQE